MLGCRETWKQWSYCQECLPWIHIFLKLNSWPHTCHAGSIPLSLNSRPHILNIFQEHLIIQLFLLLALASLWLYLQFSSACDICTFLLYVLFIFCTCHVLNFVSCKVYTFFFVKLTPKYCVFFNTFTSGGVSVGVFLPLFFLIGS